MNFFVTRLLITSFSLACFTNLEAAEKPNIVIIYADDLGYGDVGCYGATRVKTPHIDRLAARGIRFTDGHASAATCTPSRYALLTGEYAWRKKGTGVLPGDAKLIIDPARVTLASQLKKAGYRTSVVGKWHLGLGHGPAETDWNKEITPGPREIGFDDSFIIPATGDRVPCVYVENQKVAGLDPADPIAVSFTQPVGNEPLGKDHPELLKVQTSHGHDRTIINGISRIGYMAGGKAARWVDEDMADVLTKRAAKFIEEHHRQHARQPFFLYYATHDIHVPRAPHPRFANKSGCGVRGDVIEEFDWAVGEIVATLDRLKLTDSTLILISSDNGPVVDDGYADHAVKDLNGHKPAGPLRGGKYSAFEGGTRVPFIASWPGTIKPGVSDALVCQIDLLASLSALVNQALPDEAGPDSFNVLPALLGSDVKGRDVLVEQAGVLSLREGSWKYIEPGKGAPFNANTATETGNAPAGFLFNLADDLGETKNLASENPDRVQAMRAKLQEIRNTGRTRP